jgi:RHS repeat-associated protein
VVDASGAVLAHARYDAWGDPLTETYVDANYSGLESVASFASYSWDEELRLWYAQARHYDSAMRRFTSEDPARDGGNWYAYCGGNPVMCVDPTGGVFWIIPVIIGVGVAVLLSGCSLETSYRALNYSLSGGYKTVNASLTTTTFGPSPLDVYITATLYQGGVAVATKSGTNGVDLSAPTNNVTAYWQVKITSDIQTINGGMESYEILFNRTGNRYPGAYTDPKSGKTMSEPKSLNWTKVANPVAWTTTNRNNYRTWYEKMYNGGKAMDWTNLEIRHIQPREYGGTNDYSNMIVMPKSTHQAYTGWFAGY